MKLTSHGIVEVTVDLFYIMTVLDKNEFGEKRDDKQHIMKPLYYELCKSV